MRRYQLMTIIDPSVGEQSVATVQQSVEQLIEQRGGYIEEAARPERMTLATPMDGSTEGFRGFSVVTIPEDQVSDIQLSLRHHEGVLRSMMVLFKEEKKHPSRSGATSSAKRLHKEQPVAEIASSFADEAIAREINAVIEREVEKVSREEERAHKNEELDASAETRISEDEVRSIDEKLDEILGK